MDFTLHVRNLRGLRSIDWSPRGTCVVVGPNGSGKTTLLLTLKMLRAAYEQGLSQAIAEQLGGNYALKNWYASEEAPLSVGLDINGYSWWLKLTPRGTDGNFATEEGLSRGKTVLFRKNSLGEFLVGNHVFPAALDDRLGLRTIVDSGQEVEGVEEVAHLLRSISVFYDPDLGALRQQGSSASDDRYLHSRGTNVFTMLRRWLTRRGEKRRFDFVLNGLRAAFPSVCSDLDFDEAGRTVTVNIYRPKGEHRSPIAVEANGLLAMMVHLAAVASAPDGGLIAIDEPENALHPFAIRRFLELAERWTASHDQTLLLTTHSPVLLDQMAANPSSVYVVQTDGGYLVPLTDLKNPEWLSDFKLGDLYADGDFGSNAPGGK